MINNSLYRIKQTIEHHIPLIQIYIVKKYLSELYL